MYHYLFQLGHQPIISAAELEAVLSSLKHENPWPGPQGIKTLKQKNNHYLLTDLENDIHPEKLINRLGGTVKIAAAVPSLTADKAGIGAQLLNYLITLFPSGKIEFSLAGGDKNLALEVKKQLKTLGRSVRYIEPKNTATILHNKLVEKKSDLTIVGDEIFATEAIQPFEEFSERDYGRPGVDDKSGMLPPKLARIMINLAVSPSFQEGAGGVAVILDPFCGSGTILTEAATMGYTNLIGSDISEKAIQDTKKNIDWLIKSFNLSIFQSLDKPKLFISNASDLSKHIQPSSVDAIITEPYLGQPLHGNESLVALKKQTEELKNLYINSFKEFHKILKPDGTVVFIIPCFKYKNDWINIDIQNEIATATAGSRLHGGKKIGFENMPFAVETQNFASLQYHRPNQRLAREIWRFKKIPV